MADDETRLEFFKRTISSSLKLDAHPKRRAVLMACLGLIVLAAITFALEAAAGSGCNIVLSQQRFECLTSLAARTGSYKYCNRIDSSGPQSSCIISLAQAEKNASMCSLIRGSGTYHVQCVEDVASQTGNVASCSALDSENRSACAYKLAADSDFSNLADCMGIGTEPSQSLCVSEHYYNLAHSTDNSSYCAMLTNTTNSTILYQLSSQASISSYGGYSSTYMNPSPRDYCYLSLSSSTGSASCSLISNSTLRSECAFNTSKASNYSDNITTLCSASPSNVQSLCKFSSYTENALENDNVSECALISDQNERYYCVVDIATKYNQSSYCSQIKNSSDAASCYYQVGLQTGNYT